MKGNLYGHLKLKKKENLDGPVTHLWHIRTHKHRFTKLPLKPKGDFSSKQDKCCQAGQPRKYFLSAWLAWNVTRYICLRQRRTGRNCSELLSPEATINEFKNLHQKDIRVESIPCKTFRHSQRNGDSFRRMRCFLHACQSSRRPRGLRPRTKNVAIAWFLHCAPYAKRESRELAPSVPAQQVWTCLGPRLRYGARATCIFLTTPACSHLRRDVRKKASVA